MGEPDRADVFSVADDRSSGASCRGGKRREGNFSRSVHLFSVVTQKTEHYFRVSNNIWISRQIFFDV